MLIRKIVYTLIIVLIIFLFALFIFSILAGYQTFIHASINIIGLEERKVLIFAIISAREFLYLQSYLACLTILLIISLLNFRYLYAGIGTIGSIFINEFRKIFRYALLGDAKFILLLPLLASIFYAFYIPVSYDEAWTYLNFTINSPLTSISFYPAPNNHILHSLITNVTNHIPFLHPLQKLRISSIIISNITWMLVFWFIKKNYSEKIALIVTAIASTVFMSVYYSFMSRGYALILFFFILSMYAAYGIVKQNGPARYWFLFCLSGILGFYTMPSFLFPYLSIHIFIFKFEKTAFKKQIKWGFITVLAVITLYMPVIIVNGMNALVNNIGIQKLSYPALLVYLPDFLSQTAREIFGFHPFIVAGLSFLFLLYAILRRDTFHLKLWLIFMISPCIPILLNPVSLYPRLFYYLGLVLILLWMLPFSKQLTDISRKPLLAVLIVAQTLLLLNFHRLIKPYEGYNIYHYELAKKIAGPDKKYYFNTAHFDINLAFELEVSGYKMAEAKNFYPTVRRPMNADTISGYDFIIIDRAMDRTVLKKPIFDNKYIHVYN